MANKKTKKRAMRSVRSGRKTTALIMKNNETIYNVWTTLNSQQALKNS